MYPFSNNRLNLGLQKKTRISATKVNGWVNVDWWVSVSRIKNACRTTIAHDIYLETCVAPREHQFIIDLREDRRAYETTQYVLHSAHDRCG